MYPLWIIHIHNAYTYIFCGLSNILDIYNSWNDQNI